AVEQQFGGFQGIGKSGGIGHWAGMGNGEWGMGMDGIRRGRERHASAASVALASLQRASATSVDQSDAGRPAIAASASARMSCSRIAANASGTNAGAQTSTLSQPAS